MMDTIEKIATGIFWWTFGAMTFVLGAAFLIAGVQSLLMPTSEWVAFAFGMLLGGFLIGTVVYGLYRTYWPNLRHDVKTHRIALH